MKEELQILSGITTLSNSMETNYPKLHRFLDENPMIVSFSINPNLNKKTLTGYLEDLKGLLKHHVQIRTKKDGMKGLKKLLYLFSFGFGSMTEPGVGGLTQWV